MNIIFSLLKKKKWIYQRINNSAYLSSAEFLLLTKYILINNCSNLDLFHNFTFSDVLTFYGLVSYSTSSVERKKKTKYL